MATIVTRAGKGSALTYAEMDANFTNLNNDKLEAGTLATNITNTPSGNISSTTVQAAINELDTEKSPKATPIFTGVVTAPQYYNVTEPYGALQVNGADVMRYGSDTSGQLAGFRNLIINGNFSVNQRGYVSGAAVGSGLYGHDRWKMASSADTYTYTTTLNVTTITIPTGTVLQQIIEGVNIQSGTYTLSWTGTAQGKIDGGSYGNSGITGVLVGGTNTTIEFGPGTVSKVQLEFGSIATLFENRPYGVELVLCQRYLPVLAGIANADSAYSSSTTEARIVVQFKTPTRVPPTGIVVSNVAHFQYTNASANYVASGLTFLSASINNSRLTLTTSGIASANLPGIWGSNNAAALLLFTGCEL